ncbi:MAG: MFS transporter [Defluviicoccus sp.]|nr:MFS transporter [Defluviicoccus sp.]MDE0383419.1 MFS transporter [Defluviicoccus sp.]
MNRVLSAIWSVFTVRERRNVLVLAICQMLFGAGRTLLVATAALVAYSFAEQKGLATLPAALVIVGTAAASYPASMLMRRIGRRAGFVVGSLIGAVGGVICMIGIVEADFWTFTVGNLVFGFFSGFAQLYRFAATDTASREFRGTAVSLVLAGGVAASVVGAEFAKLGHDLFSGASFLGSYLFLVAATLLSALVLMFLNIPPLTASQAAQKQRRLGAIAVQPIFVAATASVLIAHSVMAMLMTAAPLAMKHSDHHFEQAAFVIMWHSLGMFAPAFVTGWFIKKAGEIAIIFTGFLLQLVCVAVALSGEAVFDYWLSMLLLGIGWNFAFTAGTTLLAGAYTPAERNRAQGASNFIVYTFVAIGSLSSGALYHFFGWSWVNLVALPALALAVAIMVWFALFGRSREPSLDAA